MERTGRKFKIVFSGLHNVQRTARQNDPIAHLGDAICIGPLLERGEWRDARALIEVPLANLGYYFETQNDSLDLVTRILSQTNYYPSLIQLYCKQLLDHITGDATRGASKSGPPYKIEAKQVEDAYRNQELQKAIRHRFMLTLRLDPRYEVIAYAIAYGFLNNGKNMTDGYPLGWIRDQVLSWWEAGFINCSDLESFRALVDEMIGLGVLRHTTSKDHYTFRSLNVISLMGNQDDIEDALLTKRELPSEYEPSIFRKSMKVEGHIKCSPLTALEMSKLKSLENGVVIITGSKASGLEDVDIFLEDAFQEGYFIRLDSVLDNASFSKKLEEITHRKKDGTTVYLVNYNTPWSEQWITSAIEKLRKLKSHDNFAKIVFIADQKYSYDLLDSKDSLFGETVIEGVTLMSLKPWHNNVVKQWLEETSLGPAEKQIEMIASVTGNWPALMYELQLRTKKLYQCSHSLEDLKKDMDDTAGVNRYLDLFGITDSRVSSILFTLAILNDDEPTSSDLCEQLENSSQIQVDKVLKWAYQLGYVSPLSRGGWKINPVVGKLLVTGKYSL